MAIRFFRLLLLLYPAPFRRRFAPDMVRAFQQDRRCATSASRFWWGVARDFAGTVPRAWWVHISRPRRRVRPGRVKGGSVMDTLVRDVRFAVRGLIRKPALGVTAVIALGFGIGLTTAMFSIVNGVILKGLPVDAPDRVVAVSRINPSEGMSRLASRYHDYLDLRERQTTLDGIAALWQASMNLSPPDGTPEFIFGASISANTFSLLGVAPIVGRDFAPADEQIGAPPVVLIGHRFWQDRFAGDPAVLGRTVRLNGVVTTIIGVMPEGFEFPFDQLAWQPLRVDALGLPRGQGPLVLMLGRTREDVTIKQAQTDLSQIMAQLGREHPETNEGMSVVVAPFVHELLGYQVPPLLYTMLGAVGLVLLIACANVTNLLLARASLRSKEVAVRTALGASRVRVVSQLLLESSVIAVAGGILGVGIAAIGIGFFNKALAALPQGIPFWFEISIDPRVLVFVLGLTVLSSLLSGILPALRASSADVHLVLKDEARGSSSLRLGRLSRGLVVLEVAFSCALLVAAGLMVKSVTRLSNIDYPFATESVLTGLIALPDHDYPDPETRHRFFRDLRERIEGEPGVAAATVTTDPPMVGFGNGRFALQGETYLGDRDYPSARMGSVMPGYFETLQTPLLEGREFTRADDARATRVAVVSQAFVNRHFPGSSPLGRRLAVRGTLTEGVEDPSAEPWYAIIGVVPDLYLEGDAFILPAETIYFPFAQRPSGTATVMMRTQGDPLALAGALRRVVNALDPDIPVSQVGSLDAAIRDQQWFFAVFGTMFTVFGVVALFLATVGLYGVLSFAVNQRKHEVGLRVALGATPGRVLGLIMRQGLVQLGVGMILGVVLAVGLARMIAVLLYDVAATDPTVFLGIVGVLVLTGLLASFLPARRATRVDPMIAMRTE